MSGLIWNAMGKSISDSGTAIGGFMSRAIERDIEMERRAREREEDRNLRRELQEDAQREQRARDELYRRPPGGAGGSGSGGGSGGGGIDTSRGTRGESILARRMGMTVPEMRALQDWSETGDTTPFQRDTVVGGKTTEDPALAGEDGETSDAVSRKYAKRELEIAKTLPPGFEAFARSKAKALGEIEAGMHLGDKNKGFQEGEVTRFQRQNAEAAGAGRMSPGDAGTLNAVAEAKPLFTVKGDTQLQQYTGKAEATDVGESKITKNERPPAPRGSGGGSRGSTGGDKSSTVQRVIENDQGEVIAIMRDGTQKPLGIRSGEFNSRIANIIRDREKNDPRFARLSEAEKRAEALTRLTGGPRPATAEPSVAPTAPAPTPRRSYSNLWN